MTQFQVTGHGAVNVGRFTQVSPSVEIVFAKPGTITIGDYCHIGPGVRVVCSGGDVVIGDWVTLHDRCLVLCGRSVTIGDHCWFGQHCVIDGTGGISIGHGVRVGMYSQLWSHVAAGEQIEGCTLIGERPVMIEDDVWLVGSCIVASGVTLGRRLVALIGSNITKSWPGSIVIAGSPAAPKSGLSFYREVTLDEKWTMLTKWLRDAATDIAEASLDESMQGTLTFSLTSSVDRVTFVRERDVAVALRDTAPEVTVCCVEDKSYNKRVNQTEQQILKFLASNKARFRAAR
jgi:acetyltransferase-like isoleucine patch superfamily enzyme